MTATARFAPAGGFGVVRGGVGWGVLAAGRAKIGPSGPPTATLVPAVSCAKKIFKNFCGAVPNAPSNAACVGKTFRLPKNLLNFCKFFYRPSAVVVRKRPILGTFSGAGRRRRP